LEQEKMSFLKYQREEHALKHDPEYLATLARDRLDLMKEGETIYRIEAPKPDKSQMRLKTN
jgi:cell division protein FtsB